MRQSSPRVATPPARVSSALPPNHLRRSSPTVSRRTSTPISLSSNNSDQQLYDSAVAAENIRVSVRVRPKTLKETSLPTAVHVENQQEIIVSRQRFRFDRVFAEDTNQESIFQEMAAPMVESVCEGVNCALFAYGQTGTGKTFTMLGFDLWQLATQIGSEKSRQLDQLENGDMRGVIPRAMRYLFTLLKGKPHKVNVSYLEIYNEKILDLLADTSNKSLENLELREDKNGLVQVIDATVKRVNGLPEVFEYLWKGAKNRAVSSTDMNEHSSRSHTIFQVTVEIKHSEEKITKAKLNLIDLAGSEKWRPHLEFSDQRIAEMTSINQSLSNLGNCIRGLLRPGKNHIPYRNSKLTRLVSDSLGGSAKTGFVVTVSPSELALEETMSTLQFADRAKKVVVRNEPNYVESNESVLKKLELELQKQVRENQELKERLVLQQQVLPSLPQQHDVHFHHEGGVSKPDRTAVVVAPIPAALSKCLSRGEDPLLISKPEVFLEDYHAQLRNRQSNGLSPSERLVLLEWSVYLQSEELKTQIQEYERLKEKEVARNIALTQELYSVRDELRQVEAAKLALSQEVSSLKKEIAECKQPKPLVMSLPENATPTRIHLEREVEAMKQSMLREAQASSASGYTHEHHRFPQQQQYGTGRSVTPKFRRDTPTNTSSVAQENYHVALSSSKPPGSVAQSTPQPLQEFKVRTFNSSRANTPVRRQTQVWDRFVDEHSGRAYYHCKESGQTTWKRPADSQSQTIIVRGE